MNTTLTTFAVALVLALFAALIGPLCVDWNAHRETLARHISDSLGEEVSLRGDVSVRLLPMPSIHARQVVVGDMETEGVPTLRVPEFTLKMALLPLLRGAVSIQQVTLERPVLHIWMSDEGNVLWPFGGVGQGQVNLSHAQIQRLEIRDGKVDIFQPDTPPRHIDQVRLDVEAETLMGPFKASGSGRMNGQSYPFSLTTGVRPAEHAQWPVSLQIGKDNRLNLDGQLYAGDAAPRFEGNLVWGGNAQEAPLTLRAKVQMDTQQMDMEDVQLSYGKNGIALTWKGTGLFHFDGQGAELTLASAYLDADRFMQRPPDSSNVLVETLTRTSPALVLPINPPFPLQITMQADRLMLGGAFVENIRLAAQGNSKGWTLDEVQAALPGKGTLNITGRVADQEFRGDLALTVNQPPAFLRWLNRDESWVSPHLVSKIAVKGALEAGKGNVRLQNMKLHLNEDVLDGQLTWLQSTAAGIPHLTLNIATAHLDLDHVMPILERSKGVWCLWCPVHAPAPPDAQQAAVEAEAAPLAVLVTFSAGELERGSEKFANVRFDASLSNGLLALNRFEMGDAFGAKLSATGTLPLNASWKQLAFKVRGDLKRLAPVSAVLPEEWRAPFLELEGEEPYTIALDAQGKGAASFQLVTQAKRNGFSFESTALREGNQWTKIQGKVQDISGQSMQKALGIPVSILPEGPHLLDFDLAKGMAAGAPFSVHYRVQDASASFNGKIVESDQKRTLAGDFDLTIPQARALRLRGGLTVAGRAWQARSILGSLDNHTVTADLAFDPKADLVAGSVSFEELRLEDLHHLALRSRQDARGQGRMAVAVQAGTLTGGVWKAEKVKADLKRDERQISVEGLEGRLAGGGIKGQAVVSGFGDAARFSVLFDADNLELKPLMPDAALVGSGMLSARGEISGFLGHIRAMDGHGNLEVRDLVLDGVKVDAGFDVLDAVGKQESPATAESVQALLEGQLAHTRTAFQNAEGVFTVQGGKMTLPLLQLQAESGSARFSAKLDTAQAGEAHFIFTPKVLPEAQFALDYQGKAGKWERSFNVNDLVQLAMLRVLESGYNRFETHNADAHEEGRLHRELKHLDMMRQRLQAEQAQRLKEQKQREDAARVRKSMQIMDEAESESPSGQAEQDTRTPQTTGSSSYRPPQPAEPLPLLQR